MFKEPPGAILPSASESTDPGADAPQFLEKLIQRAQQAGASDIHLQRIGPAAEVLFRLDGVMVPAGEIASGIAERVFGRIKFLARLKTYQDSLPQDGRINGGEIGAENDLRVATYPTVNGEKIVLRLFSGSGVRSLNELHFDPPVVRELEDFLRQHSGLLLLTGPAGSGKTTTIYACLRHLGSSGGRHVITVEDPVEQIVSGIMQTEINEARGLTFARAARHLLRQDPQVLVLGEIRDDETANLAVRAALTGHLVVSTLHAGSCRGVIERLLMMCPDRYAVISAVELILNQRLLRRLCGACSGTGCGACLQTGYRGRVPVLEWIRMNEELRTDIRTRGPAAIQPAQNLAAAARELAARQITNEMELQRFPAE